MSRTMVRCTARNIEKIAVARLTHQEDCYGPLNRRSPYEIARDKALTDARRSVAGGPSVPVCADRAFSGWENPSSCFSGKKLRDIKRTYLRTLLDRSLVCGAAPPRSIVRPRSSSRKSSAPSRSAPKFSPIPNPRSERKRGIFLDN